MPARKVPQSTHPIRIVRQNRRSLMMRALPGVIEVYIPHRMREDDPQIKQFIASGVAKLDGKVPQIPPEKTPRTVIDQLMTEYAERMQVKPARVQFREMLRKWGSCSGKGTITLNLRLTWLEYELVEYIVCHELAHLIELNHSTKFWAIVAQYMPDYRQRQQRLRQIERTLW